MARIFLSQPNKHRAEAQALRRWLIDPEREELRLSEGDIFLDADPDGGIAVGERWKEALSAANRHCEAIICLLSKHWETSSECIVEFRVAENLNKQIFIARLEPAPGERFVSTWQWCDLFWRPHDHRNHIGRRPMCGVFRRRSGTTATRNRRSRHRPGIVHVATAGRIRSITVSRMGSVRGEGRSRFFRQGHGDHARTGGRARDVAVDREFVVRHPRPLGCGQVVVLEGRADA